MKQILFKIKVFRAFITLIKDPNQTERIFQISDLARKRIKQTPPLLKDLMASDSFRELYTEKYNPKIDLEALRKLPRDSFGGSVARFLDLNQFEPNAFPLPEDTSELSYFSSRARQTHDLWHVLTGYGTGVSSELALQGFMMAQIGSLISAMIIAGGLIHTIVFKPLEIKRTFEMIVEGYTRGQQASPLLLIKLEEFWDRDLTELRGEWGLNRTPFESTLFENGQEDYQKASPALA